MNLSKKIKEKLKFLKEKQKKALFVLKQINKVNKNHGFYEYVRNANEVQSFCTYITIQKINSCARNLFNVLIYFAENIEKLNKKEEINMYPLYAYKKEDKERKKIVDGYFRFEINTQFFLKNYCKINNIRFNKKHYKNLTAELSSMHNLLFVYQIELDPVHFFVKNKLLNYEFIRPVNECYYSNLDWFALCGLKIDGIISKEEFDKLTGEIVEINSLEKIKIEFKLDIFIEIFKSVSFRTKQFDELLRKNSK